MTFLYLGRSGWKSVNSFRLKPLAMLENIEIKILTKSQLRRKKSEKMVNEKPKIPGALKI